MHTSGISLDDLRSNNSVLTEVLNSIFDGVYIADQNRQILFWNRGAEEITGYESQDVIGRCCADNILNHIDVNGRLLCRTECPLQKCISTGKEIRAKIYPLHSSGRRFPVMTHIAPLRDKAGNIIAAVEIFRDISKEEEFRLLQEKFARLVQQYVSNNTFEEMMEQIHHGAAANVQKNDLTIFYLDIVGFTPFSETHTPQESVQLLNDIFGMCDVITREHHGDIDKFIGDAIMAVFLDANDAVQAALKIVQEVLPAFNAVRAKENEPPVLVRIGINSGEVLQADIGTTDRKDRTVIGDVVNVAQRLESICPPGSLLISESCHSRLPKISQHLFTSQNLVSVKGHLTPVQVYAPANESTLP